MGNSDVSVCTRGNWRADCVLETCLEILYLIKTSHEDDRDGENEDDDAEDLRPGSLGSLAEFERLHIIVLQHGTFFGPSDDNQDRDGSEHDNHSSLGHEVGDDEDSGGGHGIGDGAEEGNENNGTDESKSDTDALDTRLETLLPISLRKLVLTGVPSGPDFLDQARELALDKVSAPSLEGENLGYWNWRPSSRDLKIQGESSGFEGCNMKFTDKLKADCRKSQLTIAFGANPF